MFLVIGHRESGTFWLCVNFENVLWSTDFLEVLVKALKRHSFNFWNFFDIQIFEKKEDYCYGFQTLWFTLTGNFLSANIKRVFNLILQILDIHSCKKR